MREFREFSNISVVALVKSVFPYQLASSRVVQGGWKTLIKNYVSKPKKRLNGPVHVSEVQIFLHSQGEAKLADSCKQAPTAARRRSSIASYAITTSYFDHARASLIELGPGSAIGLREFPLREINQRGFGVTA